MFCNIVILAKLMGQKCNSVGLTSPPIVAVASLIGKGLHEHNKESLDATYVAHMRAKYWHKSSMNEIPWACK